MKIRAVQYPVYLGALDQNFEYFQKGIVSLSEGNGDIFLLPEMWLSGFDYKNIFKYAQETENWLERLKEIISGDDLIISAMPEPSGKNEKVYNTTYVLSSDGIIAKYRKNFLFSPTREDEYFEHGNDNTVFDFKGNKIGLATCYEIRFPEIFRSLAFSGAELILIPAIWPAEKKEHWIHLTQARAIENQLFITGANCSVMHTHKKDIQCGYSISYDPWGVEKLEAGSKEGIYTVEPDLPQVAEIREKIPSFYNARDRFA